MCRSETACIIKHWPSETYTPQVGYLAKIIPFHVKSSLDIFFEIGQYSKCVWDLWQRYNLGNSCKKPHSVYLRWKALKKKKKRKPQSFVHIEFRTLCWVSRACLSWDEIYQQCSLLFLLAGLATEIHLENWRAGKTCEMTAGGKDLSRTFR